MATKPPLGNSRLRFDEAIQIEDHVQASCWLNIEDAALEKQLIDYWKSKGSTPSIQLQKRTGPRDSHKIATIKLFYNDDSRASSGGDGFEL